jgi:hypothetical protein
MISVVLTTYTLSWAQPLSLERIKLRKDLHLSRFSKDSDHLTGHLILIPPFINLPFIALLDYRNPHFTLESSPSQLQK